MKSNYWAFALTFFNPSLLVHAVDTVVVRVPTGTCVPGAYTGSFHTGARPESGTGAASGPPKIVTSIDTSPGPYSLQGCYDASAGGYTITGATTSANMTLEYCASYCKGSPYLAIQNGNTCICGTSGPSGPGVDIGMYGCMVSNTGNSAQCGGSPRYGIVYHCPTCSDGSGSSTVIVYSTTDSKGSTYLTSTTSALPSTSVVAHTTTDSKGSSYLTSTTSTIPVSSPSTTVIAFSTTDSKGSSYLTSTTSTVPVSSPATTVVAYSTTDSQGSVYVTSKTSTLPATSPSTSVIHYSTTDSQGSTYLTSTTLTAPPVSYASGPSVVVGTSTRSIVTTDSNGAPTTSVSLVVHSSTTTNPGTPPATNSANPSGRPSVCPGAGGQYTDTAGHTYQIYCGTDFPYNDLITPHIATFPECLLACDNYVPSKNVANNAACVAVSFGYGNPGGNCYLKYAISNINTGNGGFDCARMVGYTPPTATTFSLGEPGHSSSSGVQNTPQGTTSPAGPQSYTQGTTSPAGQQSYPPGNTSPVVPQSSPRATTSPAGGQGYSSPAGVQSPPAVVGGSSSGGNGVQTYPTLAGPSSSVSPSQSAFPCPSYDGIAYIDVNGEAYNVECGADYSYYDLPGTQHKNTFQDCILACDAYVPVSNVAGGAGCVGVTWGQANTGGNCYLKYQVSQVTYGRSGLDSAYKASYNKPAQSNTPTSSRASIPATTPVGQSYGPASSPTTTRISTLLAQGQSSSSAPGYGAVSSPAITSIRATSSSAAGGYGNGNPTTSTTPANSPAPYSGTEPVCPASNNTQFTNRYGTSYDVRCGVNPTGHNGKPAHADTFSRCLEFCDILSGCAAVTWSGVVQAPQSNCYTYTSITGGFTKAPGSIYSGVPTGGPTTDDVGQSKLCPAYDNQPYLDIFGKTYSIGCASNGTGNALYSTQTNTLAGCVIHCSSYQTCVGVTFTGTEGGVLVDSNTPNCFPRSSNGPAIPQAGCSDATLT